MESNLYVPTVFIALKKVKSYRYLSLAAKYPYRIYVQRSALGEGGGSLNVELQANTYKQYLWEKKNPGPIKNRDDI